MRKIDKKKKNNFQKNVIFMFIFIEIFRYRKT